MKKTILLLAIMACGMCGTARAEDNSAVATTLSRCATFMKVNEIYAEKAGNKKAAAENHDAAEGMAQAAVMLMGKNDAAVAFVNGKIEAAKPEMEALVKNKDSAGMQKQLEECKGVHAKAQAAYKAMQAQNTGGK